MSILFFPFDNRMGFFIPNFIKFIHSIFVNKNVDNGEKMLLNLYTLFYLWINLWKLWKRCGLV